MFASNRRARLGLAVGVAALLTLTACGTGTASSGASGSVATAASLASCNPSKYTLKLNFGPQGDPAVKLAVTEMQKKFPGLKFDAKASASVNYPDLTKQVVSDFAIGKPDDLINTGLSQVRFWVDGYHPTQVDEAKLPPGYKKRLLGAGTVNGKVYVAPFQVSVPVLLVNRTLLKQAGIDPDAPLTSYDEVVRAARAVSAHSGKPSINISTDILPDWYSQAFVQGAGGTYATPGGNSAGFGDPTGIQALSIFSTLAKDKTLLVAQQSDGLAHFEAGDLAFYAYSSSGIVAVQKSVGSRFDWMPMALPTLTGTAKGPMPAGGNGWLVLSQDSCKAAFASQMIDLMLTKEISLASSGTTFSYIPVNQGAADQLLASSAATPQMKWAWSYDRSVSVWGGFKGQATSQVFDAVRAMTEQLSGGADPQNTVSATAAQVDALVGK